MTLAGLGVSLGEKAESTWQLTSCFGIEGGAKLRVQQRLNTLLTDYRLHLTPKNLRSAKWDTQKGILILFLNSSVVSMPLEQRAAGCLNNMKYIWTLVLCGAISTVNLCVLFSTPC